MWPMIAFGVNNQSGVARIDSRGSERTPKHTISCVQFF